MHARTHARTVRTRDGGRDEAEEEKGKEERKGREGCVVFMGG